MRPANIKTPKLRSVAEVYLTFFICESEFGCPKELKEKVAIKNRGLKQGTMIYKKLPNSILGPAFQDMIEAGFGISSTRKIQAHNQGVWGLQIKLSRKPWVEAEKPTIEVEELIQTLLHKMSWTVSCWINNRDETGNYGFLCEEHKNLQEAKA